MTQASYFRVQSGNRDVMDLLGTENISRPWGAHHDEETSEGNRAGVSVCDSREALARYLAGTGIPFGGAGWVLVELHGDVSDDQPLDAEFGELLVHPTEIVAVAPIDVEFFELIGAALDEMEA